ncbi:MAG: hypothetical protein ACKVXR_18410 [Planctomycetota bacterium]
MIARAVVASFLTLALVPQSASPAETKAPPRPAAFAPESTGLYEEHIFFAVLEGLYHDGVSNEVVDRIIVKDEVSGYPANFVWACPACMPAYNAFVVYRARPTFVGEKVPRDTFGPGLAPAKVERLTAVDLPVAQAALEELIASWMDRRMESLRLTDGERSQWRIEMEERRKLGMSFLNAYRKNLGGSYASMKTCPICEGAN